jgi:uncharacterized protein DUF6320
MRYCKTCHIHYDTDLDHCLLCDGELEIKDDDQSVYKFKDITKKPRSNFYFRLFIFLNVMSILATLTLDYMSGLPLSWSLIVSLTNLYSIIMLLTLGNPTFWVSKFTKTIVFTISMVVLLGLAIRDHSWAVDIVFPLAIASTMLILTILIFSNRKKWFDYFASLFIITVIGLVPGLLILLNVLTIIWPSIVVFVYSILTLLGMIFLPSASSREEFKRRFHI